MISVSISVDCDLESDVTVTVTKKEALGNSKGNLRSIRQALDEARAKIDRAYQLEEELS